jgi:putative tryptophan/tyrosine transport system substrate-binding protein
MTYGPNETDIYHRAAIYVDKSLKGAKTRRVASGETHKISAHHQSQTAKQIGLTIPSNVLARADKVIR